MTDPVPVDEQPAADETAEPEPRSEPYTLDEVSAGLEALAGTVERMGGDFAEAVEELAGANVAVRDQVAQIKAQVEHLVKKERESRIEPSPWAGRAGAQDWEELVVWVDWLQASYGYLAEFKIHPCWPAHPGVVEELAGLYHSWRHAQLVDEISVRPIAQTKSEIGKRPGASDLTAWHDRWLWPFLRRMQGGHYRIMGCREQHEPERQIIAPTDRSLIPAPVVDDSKPDL